MKCPKCDGTGKAEIGVGAFTIHGADCDQCNGKGIIEPMTNEEWLHTLNTEQLAKWIQYVICHCKHCNADNAFLCQFYDKVGFVPCVGDGLVEWLKQPHTEKE